MNTCIASSPPAIGLVTRFAKLAGVALISALIVPAENVLATPIGTQWTNFNQPGVDMTNIRNQSPYEYDAYGSWWDDGSGMKFHSSAARAGQNHPDDRAGHGFIPASAPLLYHFDDSFLSNMSYSATLRVMEAFDLWETEINGTSGTRRPGVSLGFSWDWVPSTVAAQINIYWLPQASDAAWVSPHTGNWGDDTSQLDLFFASSYCVELKEDGSCRTYAPTNFYEGTGTPGGVTFDLFSTAVHELGHLIGLDDLYNLYDFQLNGFPGYVMGTPYMSGKDMNGQPFDSKSWNPYYARTIDWGSLQGALDLYSVPEPSTIPLVLAGMLLLALRYAPAIGDGRMSRRAFLRPAFRR